MKRHPGPRNSCPHPGSGWRTCLWLAAAILLHPIATAGAVGLEDVALVEALRGGGYNLYFRHAATDWSQTDRVERAGDWTSCDSARIRQLSDQGRESARRIGAAMRALSIPVDKVYASPYCRAVQTAEALTVGPIETTTDAYSNSLMVLA